MVKKLFAVVLVALSILGILDAGYISYEKLSGRVPPCNSAFKCGAVLDSPYASIGPIPLSIFGLVFYLTFMVLSSWFLLSLDTESSAWQSRLPKLLLLLGVFGAGFSIYLVFLMGVVIQAWCFYCLLSALNCVGLFCTSLGLNLMPKRTE